MKESPPYLDFGIAGLGTGLIVQVPTLFLLVYMTDILAIPAALAGLALFGSRIFDIITDPIMGIRIATDVAPAILFVIAAIIMLIYPLTHHMMTSRANTEADSNLTA